LQGFLKKYFKCFYTGRVSSLAGQSLWTERDSGFNLLAHKWDSFFHLSKYLLSKGIECLSQIRLVVDVYIWDVFIAEMTKSEYLESFPSHDFLNKISK
jgi:hypothetical protein